MIATIVFQKPPNKYYRCGDQTYFNPFHSGQYSIFLYFLSRAVFLSHPSSGTLADRIYYLNKALNSLDLFYEVQMPRIFSRPSRRLSHQQGCYR
jgi:serine O-acetyltransferase